MKAMDALELGQEEGDEEEAASPMTSSEAQAHPRPLLGRLCVLAGDCGKFKLMRHARH